jgi:hypothetical protein
MKQKRIFGSSVGHLLRGILTGTSLLFFFAVLLSILPTQTWAESTVAKGETAAISERGILASSRLRVVWVQDMGDGRDVDTMGSNLRLMGLDTGDGKGERAILGTGNYTKPLITPRGDRVVYTNRTQRKIYVVNWDGSGLRELSGGFGLAVWRDPRDDREWIYYGFEEMQKGGLTCPAVSRTLLDRPGTGELVWNKAPVNVDSFQLSEDGLLAGGNFPWPEGGVAELPNKSIKIFTKGCWPAFTTVKGKPFYWIFDGSHRNLTIFELRNNKRWQVSINGAPGIDGHEIYHPRWSNDSRVMAMTGPYKVGSGANRIAGGGREVEIYIGRFNADLTKIESWWQATRNDRADFFPDVWVASAEGVKQAPAHLSLSSPKKAEMKKPGTGGASIKAKTGSVSAAPGKTSLTKTIKRVVVEARLTEPSGIPTPQDIAPYRRALLANGYEVARVISGSYRLKKIMAAHWVIEDGQVLENAKREKGNTYRMVLERYDEHPELEGERLIMDSDEFKLPLYYELRK